MLTDAALLAEVQAVRDSIRAASQASAVTGLPRVLANPDFACVWVVKVLDSHPCTGKVGGRRLLASLGVATNTPLGLLDQRALASLGNACRCGHG